MLFITVCNNNKNRSADIAHCSLCTLPSFMHVISMQSNAASITLYTVFQKKTSTHIIGYKLRNSCLIRICSTHGCNARIAGWRLGKSVLFTALHVMQTRYSEENSVRPSVRPSVRHTRDPWQNGRKICPDFSYHTKEHLA